MTKPSNLSALCVAEEATPGELAGSPFFLYQEVNSYGDFGANVETTERDFINPSRQDAKGGVVSVEAPGAWNADFTRTNHNWLLQGFFYADAVDPVCTNPVSGDLDGTDNIDITSVTGTGYVAAAGLDDFFVGDLIFAENFGTANDGLRVVTAAAAALLEAAGLVAQATIPDDARITTVGRQFASGDVSMVISGNIASLVSAADDFADMPLEPGSIIGIGGAATNTFFATCPIGWARVRTKTDDTIVLDDFVGRTGDVAADAGAGKTLQIFFAGRIRNEFDTALIKRRTYCLERQLGEGETATMAEYVRFAVPNTFSWDIPSKGKIASDLAFVGVMADDASGETGEEIETAERLAAPGEAFFNTSKDYRFGRMVRANHSVTQQNQLFAYAVSAKVMIDNQVKPDPALGLEIALDAQPGNFKVSASFEAYFEDVEQMRTIRENADVSVMFGVFNSNGAGFVLDLPLCTLSGSVKVAKNESLKTPLEVKGAMNKFGYTLGYHYFAYLPAPYVS